MMPGSRVHDLWSVADPGRESGLWAPCPVRSPKWEEPIGPQEMGGGQKNLALVTAIG